jgi:hypothetical protein
VTTEETPAEASQCHGATNVLSIDCMTKIRSMRGAQVDGSLAASKLVSFFFTDVSPIGYPETILTTKMYHADSQSIHCVLCCVWMFGLH